MTDNEKANPCTRVLKAVWPYISAVINIVTQIMAALQAGFWLGIFMLIIIASICIFYEMNQFTGYLNDVDFTGIGVGSMLKKEYGPYVLLIVILMLLVTYCPLHLSIKLCQGLSRNKLEWIVTYICSGTFLLGFRVYFISGWEWRNFPEDKTVLYCGVYALYLVLLVIRCVEIDRLNKAVEAVRQRTQEAAYSLRELDRDASRIGTLLAILRLRRQASMTIAYSRMDTVVP